MPGQLAQLGMSTAQGAIGGIMGQLFAKANDKRQLNQQTKLQDLQIKGQKEMTDYEMAKQLEMWKATSYPGQIAMMKEAGLNPALLYGMGGGGGTTTGSGHGNVTGGTASNNASEAIAGMGMMMQNNRTAAEIELIKAQTKKAEAEATKTAGVDTELGKTQIANLTQGIKNQQAVEQLTIVGTQLSKLNLALDQATYESRIDYIMQQARQMTGLASQALIQANLDTDARSSRLDIIKSEAIQMLLKNALITAQTQSEYQSIKESESKIDLNNAQIVEITNKIIQKWKELELQGKKLNIDEFKAETEAAYPSIWNVGGRLLDDAMEEVSSILRLGRRYYKQTPNK